MDSEQGAGPGGMFVGFFVALFLLTMVNLNDQNELAEKNEVAAKAAIISLEHAKMDVRILLNQHTLSATDKQEAEKIEKGLESLGEIVAGKFDFDYKEAKLRKLTAGVAKLFEAYKIPASQNK